MGGNKMVKKYRALRIVGMVYKVIGTIILVVTILAAAGSCLSGILGGALFSGIANQVQSNLQSAGSGGMAVGGILIGFVILLWGIIVGVTAFAAGEGIYLLIDLEENTRITASLLKKE
jgi:hypothetical protein